MFKIKIIMFKINKFEIPVIWSRTEWFFSLTIHVIKYNSYRYNNYNSLQTKINTCVFFLGNVVEMLVYFRMFTNIKTYLSTYSWPHHQGDELWPFQCSLKGQVQLQYPLPFDNTNMHPMFATKKIYCYKLY